MEDVYMISKQIVNKGVLADHRWLPTLISQNSGRESGSVL